MPQPPSPYLAAIIEARRRMHAIDIRAGQRIVDGIEAYIAQLEQAMKRAAAAGLGSADQLARMVAANQVLARRMAAEVAAAVAAERAISFESTLAVWDEALAQVAAARGASALVGGLATAPVSMMGVWEAVGAPTTWRTLMAGHLAAGAGEVSAVVSRGLAAGMGPEELARGLRKYVLGSEAVADAFVDGRIDLRTLPAHQRDAARQMVYNSKRIAYSEIHHARKEAEVQHAMRDPYIVGMQWQLAPDRGSTRGFDECDVLAVTDWYGMGRGVFPVHRVPPEPHPMGRCELLPVTRLKDLDKPKPDPILAVSSPDAGSLPPGVRGKALQSAKAASARERAGRAVRYGNGQLDNQLDDAAAAAAASPRGGAAQAQAAARRRVDVDDLATTRAVANDGIPGNWRHAYEAIEPGSSHERLLMETSRKHISDERLADWTQAMSRLRDVGGYSEGQWGVELASWAEHYGVADQRRAWWMEKMREYWNATNTDNDPTLIYMQQVASKRLGVADAAMDHFNADNVVLRPWASAWRQGVRETLDWRDWDDVMAGYVDTVYDATQAQLAQAGVDRVLLVRGLVYEEMPEWAGGLANVRMAPLSSWSHDVSTAASFANGFLAPDEYVGKMLLVTEADAARVAGFARTGFGTVGQGEFVLAGGPVRSISIPMDRYLAKVRQLTADAISGRENWAREWVEQMPGRSLWQRGTPDEGAAAVLDHWLTYHNMPSEIAEQALRLVLRDMDLGG